VLDPSPVLHGGPRLLSAPVPLHVLFVQDPSCDPALIIAELGRGGFVPSWECVETDELAAELARHPSDVILSVLTATGPDAAPSLDVLKRTGLDIPFVVVSDAAVEDRAVEMMRAGATDYLLGHNLARLAPAVERALRDAKNRRDCRNTQLAADQLAAIVQSSTDSIISSALDGVVTSWNAAAEQLYGWTAEEAIGRKISFIVPPDRAEELARVMARLRQDLQVEPFETVRLHKRGTRVEISATVSPIRDPKGRLVGISKSARDIGDRKRAEAAARAQAEALTASEERHRLLVETIPHMVWMANSDGLRDYVNQRGAQQLGVPPEAIYGWNWLQLLHPDDVSRSRLSWEAAVRTGIGYVNEYRMRQADGTFRWYLAQAVALRDAGGAVERWVGTWTDIDDRKRTEHSLARDAVLLAHVGDSVIVTDLDGIVTYWNQGATRTYGWSRQEMVGRALADRMPEHARRVAELTKQRVEDHESPEEFENSHKDGSRIWIVARVTRIADAAGQPIAVMVVSHDVSRRKRAEADRDRVIEELRRQIERMPLGYLLLDADSRIVDWNSAAELIFGYTKEEMLGIGPPFEKIVPAEAWSGSEQFLERIRAGDMAAHTINDNLTKDGRTITCEWYNTPLIDVDGKYLGAVSLARDISERRAAETALRLSEERFRALVEQNSDAIVVIDRAATVTYASESIERVTGTPPAGWVGQRLFERVDPASRGTVEAALARAVERHGESVFVEYRSRHADGSWRDREASLVNRLADPAVLGVIGNFRDTTERNRARDDLQRATEQLRAFISSLPIVIWAIDRDGRVTLSEGKLLERLGFVPGELVGRSVFDLYHGVPQVIDVIHRVLAGEVTTALSTEMHGITFDSHYVVMRSEDGAITGAISVSVDVSERVRLELQLRQAQKMEAFGGLAAGIAHDFNNLLTAILGFSELALGREDLATITRGDLEQIHAAGSSAASLTRQLLAFSRKQILQPQILDLNQLVERIKKLLHRTIGEDIQLVTLLTSPLGRVCADPGQIDQVILNLAINARDAMPAGGTLTIATDHVDLDDQHRARHADGLGGPCVVISVTDTGIGMDEATLARLFEPFFTTKARDKGTGLGLATVYGIVKQSGGSISVASEPGRGTTFKIYLPRVAHASIEALPDRAIPLPGGTETILLVEDQAEVLAVANACLSRHGYKVLVATGGDEALRLAAHYDGPIHLLLTDVVMPAMSGADVSRALVLSRPGVRVLFASGYTDSVIVRHGVLEPDVDFIEKPFTPERLLTRIRAVLDRP
jgi:two-component system cell cycle sensor histidine kinase/response regulator CckA